MAKSSASGIKAGRAYVELGVDDRFTKALRAAQARLQAFGNAVRNIGLGLTAVAAAASAPFVASVKLFSDFGSAIDDAANRTGLTAEAMSELGFAAEQSGTTVESLEKGLRVMQRTLVNAAEDGGAAGEAIAALERCCELQPDFADAWYNLGNTLLELDRLDEAEAAFRRALALAPGDMETETNLGSLLKVRGKLDESLALWDSVLSKRDDLPEVHRNRAALWLLMGDFHQGWAENEWRFRTADAERFNITVPRWQGEPLTDKTILLIGEQGIGDVLQMVRFAAQVKQRGATVWLQYAESLFPLLRRTPGIDRLISASDPARGTADYHIGLLSLPMIFEATLETIPSEPYVQADPQRVARWRDTLNE